MKKINTAITNKKNLITGINGLLLIISSFIIFLSLLADSTILHLVSIPVIIYAVIFIMIAINLRLSLNLRKWLGLIVILLVFSFIISLFNNAYLGQFLMRLSMILLGIITYSNVQIPKKAMNIISLIMMILTSYFFIKSFGYNNAFYQTNELSSNYNAINPNSMGLVVLFSFMIADRGAFMKSHIVRFAIIIASFVALFNFGSRNALLCLALYIASVYILKNIKTRGRKIILAISLLVALLFPIIYVSTYDSSLSRGDSVEILGKDIYSGRQDIWTEAMTTKNIGSIFVGNSNLTLIESLPSKSLHNMYIDIGYQLGIPYLLFFMFIIYIIATRNPDMSRKVFASILILLIYGYFETTFEAGGYTSLLMLLVFMNVDSSEKYNLVRPNRGVQNAQKN